MYLNNLLGTSIYAKPQGITLCSGDAEAGCTASLPSRREPTPRTASGGDGLLLEGTVTYSSGV